MSRRERERLSVFGRIKDKQLKRKDAAVVLGMSLRQVHRMYRRYLADGDKGLVHRGRGRVSPRRTDEQERLKALELYRSMYRSWGPTFFAEKLGPVHGIWVSHDTARRWLIVEGLLEKPRRGRRSRRRRVRRERFGQLLQMDGSHHAWFGSAARRCCLMVMIDDATGRMLGRFYEGESLAAAMDAFGRWCRLHGIPRALYVDRAGIYRCDREPTVEELTGGKRPATQFGRAMKELDVRLIMARSPQAKGRVERANATMQDRLVKELKLAGITTIEAANAWLDTSGFFTQINQRFGVTPMDPADAHRPVVMDLNDVLCEKDRRSVSNDGCVQWSGRVLQLLKARPGLSKVEVWQHADGTLTILDGGKRLAYEPWEPKKKVKEPLKNNKRYKPGKHQQLVLRPRGKPSSPTPGPTAASGGSR